MVHGKISAVDVPFNVERLDRLMDAAGVDVVLACSPHNVSYLLGGYRFFMFAHGTVMGVSRYLPMLGYVRGAPERAFFVGNPLERGQQENEPLWVSDVRIASWTSRESGRLAAEALAARGLAQGRVAIEPSFLPHDAHQELAGAELVDGSGLLDELRAVKRPDELVQIRAAAEAIIDSMEAVFAAARPGVTQQALAEHMHLEEARRGLDFEYCLINSGRSFNRAPTAAVTWNEGELCCLDSGGSLHGYVGDMARMGFMGDVPERARELLQQVDAVQQAARTAIAPGRPGRRDLCRRRSRPEAVPGRRQARLRRARDGPDQPRGAAPDLDGPGRLSRRACRPPAGGRHGPVGRDRPP